MLIKILIVILLQTGFSQSEKHYIKNYDDAGNLTEEGWMKEGKKSGYWYFYQSNGSLESKGHFAEDQKQGYWYFYDQNGNLLKEGHYQKDLAINWWIFYKAQGISEKVQFKKGRREGYALIYKNGTLFKAERYENNRITGSWTSISGFKRDNPNARF